MRFTEYVTRFVRLASYYEEEVTGVTKVGHPSSSFSEQPGRRAQLGSGIAFSDEATSVKELAANAQRIEAWRKTNSYHHWVAVSLRVQRKNWLCFTARTDYPRISQSSKPTARSRALMSCIN